MSTFKRYLAEVLDRAVAEAGADRSSTVEAQHVLLAILAEDKGDLLDHDEFRAALALEFEQSLGVAGVSLSAFDLAPATPDPASRPGLGNSVRLALDRAMRAAGTASPRPEHLLIGILSAEVGTVPRALARAGVDRPAVLARLQGAVA